MFIKNKIKKIAFCNYFKNPDIVFLFLFLCISLMILCFFRDFNKSSDKGKHYFDNSHNAPSDYPHFVKDGILDYNISGYFPGHNTFIKMYFYFTYQSNLFVLIIYALFFTKVRQKKWYQYLIFMCLISILMTGFIYHIIIDKFKHFTKFDWELKYIISHLQHTIIPLTYLYFYFFVNTFAIPYKKIWVGYLHALFYMVILSSIAYLKMIPYYSEFKLDQPIITNKDDVKRDPFRLFPYVFFSPFCDDPTKELPKKSHRFVFKGYAPVFKLFFILFCFISLMMYFLLWSKKKMVFRKTKKL
ncbi:hypothetical protein [Candidatus Phytoplasma australiense]|uniref:Uncharacterized protein n=1 Tax=Strawberry lethal yellows phytoplasma (CPA) str. NZSb11 TaxID=980422 RepID=R4RM61_PHYAS|nr:hypothetical protein [Candidatus Phytoplasma australiense]AGL90415.1 hypothetical protein SLY_0495 [Strawberry lethal yellows phytoplasma (CPA) str. NZSb11]